MIVIYQYWNEVRLLWLLFKFCITMFDWKQNWINYEFLIKLVLFIYSFVYYNLILITYLYIMKCDNYTIYQYKYVREK